MMSTAGFYKFEEELLRFAPNAVYAPNFTLLVSLQETYTYPIEGWHYFATTDDAESFFAINGQSEARWVEFGQAVLASTELGQLYEVAPRLLAHGLTAGLLQAVNQTDSRPFAAAWTMARGLGLISDELLAGVLSMAQGFDLPAAFIEALTVPPPAQNLGQEWTSPDGTLYRVAQAFDDDGQFLPDDPATPPRESLRWVVVEP